MLITFLALEIFYQRICFQVVERLKTLLIITAKQQALSFDERDF